MIKNDSTPHIEKSTLFLTGFLSFLSFSRIVKHFWECADPTPGERCSPFDADAKSIAAQVEAIGGILDGFSECTVPNREKMREQVFFHTYIK